MGWFEGFAARMLNINGVEIHVRTAAHRWTAGAAAAWLSADPCDLAPVAPRLGARFALVMPDLRGHGRSAKPDGGPDHAAYSKRVMAADQIAVMDALGRSMS